ncbi:hypothetical protein KPH14_011096 [Odynerus spinipes]|uniref:Uncharacterized protein n=1 Tax=Odynerus spinipes TaxID=1348599 RepID=A0AAD9RIK1_9HYME|nr:hypothetical protein KPH14_011096 [Odynerus spinipes]
MIFETTDESRDFATIYTVDYPPRVAEKLTKCEWKPRFPPPLNILNGPYKRHLNTCCKNESLPVEKRTEDPRDYADKVRKTFPHLNKLLPQCLNEEIAEREEKKLTRTVYQVDYSKDLDDFLSLRAQKLQTHLKPVTLPEGWIIPQTVQKRSFRNPWEIIREDLLRVKVREKPTNNLDPNPKEREILRVRTGTSEYYDVIGATADLIMREKPYGTPLPIEPPAVSRTKESDEKSECSLHLASKNLALPSDVL